MKLSSTTRLTFVILVMMLGAGILSGFFGFTLGHEALKSVSQPHINPIKKLTKSQPSDQPKGFTIVKEREILVKVYDRIHGQTEAAEDKPQPAEPEEKGSVFPLKAEDSGVVLEVLKANKDQDSLLLDISLRNNGSEAVRFLYSFLEVRSQEQPLGAITDGLPGEIPATGKDFLGTVTVPLSLLDDAQEISLKLTDYPKQNLQLEIPKIPVAR